MKLKYFVVLLAILIPAFALGMGRRPPDPEPPPIEDPPPVEDPEPIPTEFGPILMIHGLWGNGTQAWASDLVPFLLGKGWTGNDLYYPSMSVANTTLCSSQHMPVVKQWFEDIKADHPGEKITLIGHSRGGANIMQALYEGHITPADVKYVILLSSAHERCTTAPGDATPGDALYTVIYSSASCDTARNFTHVAGAEEFNLNPLCHADTRKHPDALALILRALHGEIGDNN